MFVSSLGLKFSFGKLPVKLNAQEPFLQDEVYVAGYPEGGDTISITKVIWNVLLSETKQIFHQGIVSRIEAGPYTDSL